VDAVRGAVEVQSSMAEQNASVPQELRIEFRIGIHVGDIIIDENDIFGDGVNVAARLDGIAAAGGVCISNDAYRQVRNIRPLLPVDSASADAALSLLYRAIELDPDYAQPYALACWCYTFRFQGRTRTNC